MNEKPKATIEPYAGTVKVMFSDAIVASTDNAVLLKEEGHDPVFYIPFEDIYFEFLRSSSTVSRCPLKGKARYWNAEAVGSAADDVMWAYDHPLPEMEGIRQHGAFDPSKVKIEATPQQDILHTPHLP
ncbi:DUF427 domain-containing protein [Chelativorans sp. Marseille-P2723]|uniref:DUF427 domain-containing protein n=1 Tax=Chelativorans sp. Marseille-P2723 TaxID=2709133 RepID=UPI001FEE6D17|nr:DUF427 domain-containing protein [Chelativorans sp. Marseille-P2723]